jgi:hypothetical protein
MPSRRRSRSKNLNNNLADVQRRLRFLERRPVRTKLANRVVTRAAIAPNSVSADEAEFGTSVVVPPGEDIEDVKSTIENPKEGFLVVDASTGESQIYSETQETYYDVSDPVAQVSADAAANAAALAAANAQAAQTTADGKNAVYRAATAPTTPYTGTNFVVGDIWFNTSLDGQINRWSGTAWAPFTLGNNALASISANKITAGTIDASVITVSNINAQNITSGNIAAERLSTTQLSATNITTGELRGITIQTSASGNRIAMTNTDELQFFNVDGARIGTIGPFDFGSTNEGLMFFGGSSAFDAPVVQAYNDGTNRSLYMSGTGLVGSPSISLNTNTSDEDRVFIIGGGSTSTFGAIELIAGPAGIDIGAWTSGGGGKDYISIQNDYAGSGSVSLSADRINLLGTVKFYNNVEQGSGAPANYTGNEASNNIGAVVFRYT